MSPFCAWKRKGSTDFDFEVVTLSNALKILPTTTQLNIAQNTLFTNTPILLHFEQFWN